MQRTRWAVAAVALVAGARLLAAPQTPAYMSVDDVRPGQVGVGRTVFAGDAIETFQVHVLGVLRNVNGPKRDLILARLSGPPLEKTGVIQGMSGSPVYINNRLIGAVAYALGSFPTEALAGITPIGEMVDALSGTGPRGGAAGLALAWPATPAAVYAALGRVARRAASPLGSLDAAFSVTGPSALAGLAPTLRPIGAAMAFSGFDIGVDRDLRDALGVGTGGSAVPTRAQSSNAPLRPGDAVGMALIRGDYEIGATGTVTHVDGSQVYAFGHPFLNVGSTAMAMTRARVYTVIPSLDSSIKVAVLGPVVGAMTQDRTTGVGGTLGAGPRELAVSLTLRTSRGGDRRVQFYVLHDQTLTPLFAYVALLNTLTTFERQSGAMTIAVSGQVSFGADSPPVVIDDLFSGEGATVTAAAAATASIGIAANNEFRPALAERLDLTLQASEQTDVATIERAWLDTTRPRAGATHTLNVLLRRYRGGTETVTLPITMPTRPGPVTLVVADGPSLTTLEDRDLRPGRPTSWADLVVRMNSARRNNRLYVRLLTAGAGTVVAGETLPALPGSVRTILGADESVATASVTRTIVGAWELRLPRVVRGSREMPLIVENRQEK
jgi:hypothetical protein